MTALLPILPEVVQILFALEILTLLCMVVTPKAESQITKVIEKILE